MCSCTGLQSEFVLTIHSLALLFYFPVMDWLLEHSTPRSWLSTKNGFFFKIDVQLVSQCKLPTKQLHDLKCPAFWLAALMLATWGHATVMCVCMCVCVCVCVNICVCLATPISCSIEKNLWSLALNPFVMDLILSCKFNVSLVRLLKCMCK